MSNLCIIPARGGSKRIPRKNIKLFLGKPIIAYSIELALRSKLFDKVMVSTDDDEIASIARQYGAEVPFNRKQKTSDDFATLSDVVDEVYNCYQEIGEHFDCICCILPTSPLLSLTTLGKGLELMLESKYDSVRAIVKFSYPIQRAFKLTAGKVEFAYPEYKFTRSQDLEPTYHDSGQFYWMTSESRMAGNNKGGFEISALEVQDIDEEVDWKLAEMKYEILFP